MEDEITKTIQELKLNEKKKVKYQGVTYLLINKNNKLCYKTESSLTFDLVFYAILILICFFLIAIGIPKVGIGILTISAIILYIYRILERLGFVHIFDVIYSQIVKKTTGEFIDKYANVKIIENN